MAEEAQSFPQGSQNHLRSQVRRLSERIQAGLARGPLFLLINFLLVAGLTEQLLENSV